MTTTSDFEAGRMAERSDVLKRLRYGVREFRSLSASYDDKWAVVAEILEEEADAIEQGNYI